MLFTKTREVKSPTRAHSTDAGIDFFVPEYSADLVKDIQEKNKLKHLGYNMEEHSIIIPPSVGILIPAGIKVQVPDGQALVAFNKSGVATKKQLIAGACVVDIGYTGEVHINVINTSNSPVQIRFGEKLIQFLLLNLSFSDPIEIDNNEYENITTVEGRGNGGFGSTN